MAEPAAPPADPCEGVRALAAPGVRALQPYAPGKPLAELEREYGIRDAIKLASNENPLGPSPAALAAAAEALAEAARYPDGNGFALKQALAARLDVPAGWITLGNGSNDVLELVARAFLTPAHAAVFSAHAFAVYPLVTQAIGAAARVAPAHDGRRGPVFGHDLAAMASRVDADTRVVFIASPNNPTGTWVDADALRALLDGLPDHVIAVVDEAYAEYVDADGYPDTVPWVQDYPNLVVTRTFSKAYGLAGLRVGYAVCRPCVADLLNRVRQPFNVNCAAQAAALAALDDTAHLARSVDLNREQLARLGTAFEAMGLDYIPSVGNFITVDTGTDPTAVYEALLRRGVIVRPVANYGLPGHLRITVGTAPENERLLAALPESLAEARG